MRSDHRQHSCLDRSNRRAVFALTRSTIRLKNRSVLGGVSAHVTGGHFASSLENGGLANGRSSGIHFLRYPVALAVQVPMILPVLSFSDPVAEIVTFPGQTLLMPADEPPIPEN